MKYKNILIEKYNDLVMHIILNRKNKYNALNSELTDELIDALKECDQSELIKCVVISGSENFSAGADIHELASNPDFIRSWEFIDTVKKPIIAAVNGIAFGGGNELLLMCDIILASKEAKFAQPEISLGLICGGGGTQRLPWKIGKGMAMEMCLTGNSITAEEAKDIGLINHIYDTGELIKNALQLADIISLNPMDAIISTKKLIKDTCYNLSDGLIKEKNEFMKLLRGANGIEGMNAFLERRKPQFKN